MRFAASHKAPILLATLNARYSHSSFGLRRLQSALAARAINARLCEFTNDQTAEVIAESLLAQGPRIIAFGVYIWNVARLTLVAEIIHAVRPEITLILGGPEVSHEYEGRRIFAAADYLICGEGEVALPDLVAALDAGEAPAQKVIHAAPPNPATLPSPYAFYTEEDIAHRAIYVESTRGCPFRCAFCLSGRAEERVRYFPRETFLAELDRLLDRGVWHFRFIDRTFNVQTGHALALLDFFLARLRPKLRLHLEIVPDCLEDQVIEKMQAFPPGVLHLEAGVQSFHPPSLAAINRRQDRDRTCATLRRLRESTGVLIHADLLIGLPEETEATFAQGFDRLVALRPHEIQVGPLKRLRGSPLSQEAEALGLRFSQDPPYRILQSPAMTYECIQSLSRLARYMDLFYNAGNFPRSLPRLFELNGSAYRAFQGLCQQLWRGTGREHRLSLVTLMEHLYRRLLIEGGDPEEVDHLIHEDFHRIPNRRETIRPYGGNV